MKKYAFVLSTTLQTTALLTGISKAIPGKNINISNSPLMVAGNWAGTQTNDNGLYPQNFGFELTTNGEIVMKYMNGAIAAKGSFAFSNYTLTSWHKQVIRNETFSLSSSYVSAEQKISRTLGSGTKVTRARQICADKKINPVFRGLYPNHSRYIFTLNLKINL